MSVKFFNIIGQIALSFLPAVIVAYTTNTSLDLAGSLSQAFAITGLIFSTFYLGQRSYIAVNGTISASLHDDMGFRDLNIIIATALVLALAYFIELPLWICVIAVSIKLSEYPIDLSNGYNVKNYGSAKASSRLAKASVIRAGLISLSFIFFSPLGESTYSIYSMYLLIVAVIVRLYYRSIEHKRAKIVSKTKYWIYVKQLKYFALATIACSMLSALPRLVVEPINNINNVVLIALSVTPVIAVIFQGIWLSNIEKLSTKLINPALVFYLEVIAIIILVYFSSPLWKHLIPLIYGIESNDLIQVFISTVCVMTLLFGGMTLSNLFKFYKPKFESISYVLASAVIMFCFNILNFGILESFFISGIFMFLFSLISPIKQIMVKF